jgi:menaquinone-specific isochorismate synthase
MSFPSEKALWARFAQSEVAVYFASGDKRHRYYGFGVADELIGGDFAAVSEWVKRQPYPVFGGFRFDGQTLLDSDLMNGYFFRPAVLYDATDQVLYGRETNPAVNAVRAHVTTIVQVAEEADWPERVARVTDIMKSDPTRQKVVLGRQTRVVLDSVPDLATLLSDLAAQQPTAYHFVLKRGAEVFVSATPERLAMVQGGRFQTAAVAGTTRRGADATEDDSLAAELLADEKNLVEHDYVAKAIAAKLADIATITMADGPTILQAAQLQHLYTPVDGQLNDGQTVLDLAERLHPTPALGGQPVEWALATIAAVEVAPRGLFAGPVGMVKPNGDGELVVGIRSMWLKDETATLFAGAGILAQSQPEAEWQETALKMQPMMNILRALENEQ